MNKFIVPEQDIDRLAIEEAVRNDAWLVLPKCIDFNVMIDKAENMGFDDRIKLCYWNALPLMAKDKIVFAYSDRILEEMSQNSS